MKRLFSFITISLFAILLNSSASAHDVESAVGYYWDDQLTATIMSVVGDYQTRALFKGAGQATSLRLGYTGKQIHFKEPSDLLAKQLGGQEKISQNAVSAAIDQGLRVGTSLGVSGGAVKSPLSKSSYLGVRGSQWWLLESVQTTLEVRQTKAEQPELDYTDTDGKRIVTPTDLNGMNVSLMVMNFATPTTILRGSLSRTTRSDRPPADSVGAEVRQYIATTRSAVHVAMTHYENVGSIEPNTQYGTIVANSVRAEWHQRLPRRLIAMAGYRYYLEVENPRAADADNNQIGADSIYSALRWRFGDRVWTDDGPELYGFMARYTTNAPTTAYMLGVGCRIVL